MVRVPVMASLKSKTNKQQQQKKTILVAIPILVGIQRPGEIQFQIKEVGQEFSLTCRRINLLGFFVLIRPSADEWVPSA